VEAGADLDRPNPDGITPLLNAIDSRHFDIAMYLIDRGAKVDVWDMHGRTPIYMAVDMNSFRGGGGFGGGGGAGGGFGGRGAAPRAESNVSAMDIAHRLLDMGVDVNHELTRMRPNGPGRGRFADYMTRGGTGPLMVATLSHDHEAIELLLGRGAEVDLRNVFQITPLMAAAGMSGTVRAGGGRLGGPGQDPQATVIRTIDLLLDAGANVNAQVVDSHTNTAMQDSYIPGADNEGKTALHAAAENGWPLVVRHLLERGADPTIKDAYGDTALDLAARDGGAAGGAGSESGGQAPAGPSVTDVLLQALRGVPADD